MKKISPERKKVLRLDEAAYTIFDVETTGLFPYSGDKICEIAAVRLQPGGPQKIFQTLVNPERPVSYGAFKVNGITMEMLRDKPLQEEVVPSFMEFVRGSVLVAYNAGFDLGFLESALADKGSVLSEYKVIDALKLARNLFPEMSRYNLGCVASSLGIDTSGQHRALADAMITAKVFKKEMKILLDKGIILVDDISEEPRTRGGVKETDGDLIRELVRSAIKAGSNLNITYQSAWDDTTSIRAITPRSIREGFDRSYVVAYCHLKKELRNFRLDCIISAERL